MGNISENYGISSYAQLVDAARRSKGLDAFQGEEGKELNSPTFSRRPRFSFPGTVISDRRTSQCSRTLPTWPDNTGLVGPAAYRLTLEQIVEALGHSIVMVVPAAAHLLPGRQTKRPTLPNGNLTVGRIVLIIHGKPTLA